MAAGLNPASPMPAYACPSRLGPGLLGPYNYTRPFHAATA